jgi:hypothetical protein
MRKIARQTRAGHNHALSAAIVMTAFSVEAFVQTLGPDAYGAAWTALPRPAERLPVKDKLKHIAKTLNVPIDYGKSPWKQTLELLRARDSLAHPKPHPRPTNIVFEAVDGDDARLRSRDVAFFEYNPMHDIDLLDRVADEIQAGLITIWNASGGNPHVLKAWGMGLWTVTEAGSE